MFFLFSFLLNQVKSSIYSFDFGTKNVRTALGIPGKPIEILLNDQSSRSTPNQLAYAINANESQLSQEQWFFGAEAERIISKNATHGVKNPFHYLGTPESFPIKDIDPITACSLVFSLHLRKFKRKHDKLIVSVPSIFTPHARRALIQTFRNLNYSSTQLIDSNTAVASLYAIERLPKNLSKPYNVLFIDVGAAQTEISLWSFQSFNNRTLLNLNLTDYQFSDRIGGDAIDERLIKNVTSSLPREPLNSERIPIANAVRRAKEQLAAGPDSTIDLMTDFNIRIPLTRPALEQEISDIISNYKALLMRITANHDIKEIDEIELIGGTTRLPAIVEATESIFGSKILRRSLNSDEAVAIGAAYYAGLQMGIILGPRIQVFRPSLYGLDFIFKNKTTPVFKAGDIIDRKAVTLRHFNDFSFSLKLNFHENPNIQSSMFDSIKNQLELSNVEVYHLHNFTRNITSQLAKGTRPFLRFNFGHSQTIDEIDILSSSLIANVSLNLSIEGTNTSVNSTSMSWNLQTHIFNFFPFFRQIIKDNVSSFLFVKNYNDSQEAAATEMRYVAQFKAAAQERRKHDSAQHKLEGFVIDFTDKIQYDEDFRSVTTDQERTEIGEILSRERQTIEISGARVSSAELKKRLSKLKERLEMPLLRYTELKGRPAALANLNKTMQKAEIELQNAVCDQQTKKNFIEYMNHTSEMINNAMKITPLDYPQITVEELKERDQKMKRLFTDLKRKPKTVTVSTDPNSPNYDPKKLKELGINIVKNEKLDDAENSSEENSDNSKSKDL